MCSALWICKGISSPFLTFLLLKPRWYWITHGSLAQICNSFPLFTVFSCYNGSLLWSSPINAKNRQVNLTILHHAITSVLRTSQTNLWHGKGLVWTMGVDISGITWSTDEFLGRHIIVCWFLKSFAWEWTYRSATLAAHGKGNVLFTTLRAFALRCLFQDIIFMHSKWVTGRENKYKRWWRSLRLENPPVHWQNDRGLFSD